MADKVVLHVGLMKSGTTFIQRQLFAHQATLRDRGTLVPGQKWADQVKAVKDVIRPGKDHDGAWADLAGRVREWPGTAVVSMEFLGPAGPKVIHRLVESVAPAPVQVIVTARDLNRSIAALWQETIQNGRHWGWPEYVEGVRAACPWRDPQDNDAGRTFWRQQDVARVASTWAAAGGGISLVTVPHPGAPRGELLDRFTSAAGLGDLEVAPSVGNESLGAASTLALRRMNELLSAEGLDYPKGSQVRKGVLAKKVLAARRSEEPSLGLAVQDWVVELADELVARAQEVPGVELVGDWADLAPVEVPGIDPADVPPEAVAEAAISGLAGLIAHRARK